MKIILCLALAFASSAYAESPVGGGKVNWQFDSSPCYSWTGNTSGASWSRCATPPVVVQQVTQVQPVIVEKVEPEAPKCIVERPKKIGG